MKVLHGATGLCNCGDLRFAIRLDHTGTERRGPTPELQQTADGIVSSFELEKR